MQPELPVLDASAIGSLPEALERAGAAIVTGVATAGQCAALRRELAPYLAGAQWGVEENSGINTRRIGRLVKASPTFREIIQHPTLLASAAHFLGGPEGYQLYGTMAIEIHPNSPAQPLHTDEQNFQWPQVERKQPILLVNLLAIDPFTEENGATRIIPGSHLWSSERQATPEDRVVSAVMPPGAVCIVLGSTVHSGGENRSNAPRLGLRFSYSTAWLRQEENQFLATPPELVATFSSELKGLLGFKVVDGLGFVDTDPVDGDDVMGRLFQVQAPPDFILEALERQRQEREAAAAQPLTSAP
jgi:hypothetical protein